MNIILTTYPAINYTLIAKCDNDGHCIEFICAYQYDKSSDSWNKGHYYESLDLAIDYIRDKIKKHNKQHYVHIAPDNLVFEDINNYTLDIEHNDDISKFVINWDLISTPILITLANTLRNSNSTDGYYKYGFDISINVENIKPTIPLSDIDCRLWFSVNEKDAADDFACYDVPLSNDTKKEIIAHLSDKLYILNLLNENLTDF